MPTLKLTYFDFHGGRGEPARLALAIAGIAFENHRISFAEWGARKADSPYLGIPLLEVDGKILAQSNAINRYVGKMAKLYPTEPWAAAICDEIMEAAEDMAQLILPTFHVKDEEEKKAQRIALAEGPVAHYLKSLGVRLSEGGDYFVNNQLTMADLRVFVWIRHMLSGALDYFPTDLAGRVAPQLLEHFERIKANPSIINYYASMEK